MGHLNCAFLPPCFSLDLIVIVVLVWSHVCVTINATKAVMGIALGRAFRGDGSKLTGHWSERKCTQT